MFFISILICSQATKFIAFAVQIIQPDKIQGGTVTVCIQFFLLYFFDFGVAGLAFDSSSARCCSSGLGPTPAKLPVFHQAPFTYLPIENVKNPPSFGFTVKNSWETCLDPRIFSIWHCIPWKGIFISNHISNHWMGISWVDYG